MTTTPKPEEAINIVIKQLEELADITNSAKSSGDALLGFEKFRRWKSRTASLLSENIHPNEGKKLKDIKPINYVFGGPLRNLVDEADRCWRFLESLREELEKHPEYFLDVPIRSDEEVTTMEAPQPTSKRKPKNTDELLLHLYDAINLHPKIINASRTLFKNEYYAQAIFEAYKAVENFVQDKSGLTLYGTNLMERVFNEENPIIKVPEAGHYYKEVQKGFKHLFIGAAQGIRNPKAHKEIIQKDPYITLQYLGFFSFLLKRIDYWDTDVS